MQDIPSAMASQTFVHVDKAQTPGENPPRTSHTPWGLYLAPLSQPLAPPHLRREGQSEAGKNPHFTPRGARAPRGEPSAAQLFSSTLW